MLLPTLLACVLATCPTQTGFTEWQLSSVPTPHKDLPSELAALGTAEFFRVGNQQKSTKGSTIDVYYMVGMTWTRASAAIMARADPKTWTMKTSKLFPEGPEQTRIERSDHLLVISLMDVGLGSGATFVYYVRRAPDYLEESWPNRRTCFSPS